MPYVDENGEVIYCTFCDSDAVYLKHDLKHSTQFCATCYEAYIFGKEDVSDDPTHLDDVEDVEYKE